MAIVLSCKVSRGSTAGGDGLRLYQICLEMLPMASFPLQGNVVKGSICTEDSAASEFLQRTLKSGWGQKHYQTRYGLLRKRKDTLRSLIISIRMNPEKRGKKRIQPCLHVLRKIAFTENLKKRRRIIRPMTYPVFAKLKMSVEGGEYSAEQVPWP